MPPPLPWDSSRFRSTSADSSHTAFRFWGALDLAPNKTALSELRCRSAAVRDRGYERGGGGGCGRVRGVHESSPTGGVCAAEVSKKVSELLARGGS